MSSAFIPAACGAGAPAMSGIRFWDCSTAGGVQVLLCHRGETRAFLLTRAIKEIDLRARDARASRRTSWTSSSR